MFHDPSLLRQGLEGFTMFGGYYRMSIDGPLQSDTIHCDNCQTQTHRDGTVSYSYLILTGVLVYPDYKTVSLLAPEMIGRGYGSRMTASTGRVCGL